MASEFSVVDVETTGFRAEGRDRIVEIAIIRVNRWGELIDEYTTLINPGRDPGPTEIHGITDDHVVEAPDFGDVAGEIAERMIDSIITGHNISFDLGFIGAEFARAGHPLPPTPTLCTVRMARAAGMPVPRTLAACCDRAGVRLDQAHTAHADTMATAKLMLSLRAQGIEPESLVRTWTPKTASARWPQPEGFADALPRYTA